MDPVPGCSVFFPVPAQPVGLTAVLALRLNTSIT
jgi:hypothetical protein